MTLVGCSAGTVATVFAAASERYEEGLKELCALDAVAGDGDLGISFASGFKAATLVLEAEPKGELSSRLRLAALAFNRAAPSTLGTLTTAAILAVSAVASEGSVDNLGVQSRMLTAALEAIMSRGKATFGDKTVLDALGPATDAFRKAAANGATIGVAVGAARLAAQQGAEMTRGMLPKAGRARWMAERSLGHPDAGAVAAAWFFESWEGLGA